MKKDTFDFSDTRILQAVTEVIPLKVHSGGMNLCMQILSATNEDHGADFIDFGYLRGPAFVPLKTQVTPAVTVTYALETTIYMIIDDVPAVRIRGGTVGDHVQVAVSGYISFKSDLVE